MPGVEDFASQLRTLGYEPEIKGDFVLFDYQVPVGARRDQVVRLGLRIPPDWPSNPPTGPYVSPRLLPIDTSTGKGRPWDSVHEASAQGMEDPNGDWQYWSRPFPATPGWAATVRTVKTYLGHIKTLFDELPDDET